MNAEQFLKSIDRSLIILIWTFACILLYEYLQHRSKEKMNKEFGKPGIPMFKDSRLWPPSDTPLWIKLHDKALPNPFIFYTSEKKILWFTVYKGWFERNDWRYEVKDVTRWSFTPFEIEEKENV